MSFKPHPPAGLSLIGYDPAMELADDHLARFIDQVVDSAECPKERSPLGQSGYHPRMLMKLMVLAYATGTFSSRRIAQNCQEHLAYLYLSRGERPCFRTLCAARTDYREYLERIWLSLLATAASEGISSVGRISVDASRFKASASRDLVVEAKDYDALVSRLEELLARARQADALEDAEDTAIPSRTGVPGRVTVRTVVRSLGKEVPEGTLTSPAERRLEECVQTLQGAKDADLKHVSLSDPDARMMPIGSARRISMGHALEVAVDSGLLVAGGSTNAAHDAGRLTPLVEAAKANGCAEVTQVLADSGYFTGEEIVALQDAGLEVVVPDATTAGLMRGKGQASPEETIRFEKIQGRNAFICPQGNVLVYKSRGAKDKRARYRAVNECTGCPLAGRCLKNPKAKRRTYCVQTYSERIKAYLQSFETPEMRAKYYSRGPGVETVFAVIRRILGFVSWSVRGAGKISAEAELLKCAYQVRKLQSHRLQSAR